MKFVANWRWMLRSGASCNAIPIKLKSPPVWAFSHSWLADDWPLFFRGEEGRLLAGAKRFTPSAGWFAPFLGNRGQNSCWMSCVHSKKRGGKKHLTRYSLSQKTPHPCVPSPQSREGRAAIRPYKNRDWASMNFLWHFEPKTSNFGRKRKECANGDTVYDFGLCGSA